MKHLTMIYVCFVIISLMFTGITDARIDPETIAGLWLFDEGKGKVAEDSSDNSNDGEIEGHAKWVNGKFGEALEFNGSDSYVEVPKSESVDVTDAITIVAWVKTSVRVNSRIVSKGSGSGGYELMYSQTSPGGIAFYFRSPNAHTLPGKSAIDDGNWHHTACSFDGEKMRIFVDGVMESEATFKGQISISQSPVRIGRHGAGASFFQGVIDEVAIFNVGMVEDDIKQVMKGLGEMSMVSCSGKLATTWASVKGQ